MKLIHKFKSPNFNQRKYNQIYFIIIHYTALQSISESIKYLTSKKNKVSCHYIISNNGQTYRLVSENKRAWHAGQSYWKGIEDVNSTSIGIELDYLNSNKQKFNESQINSLIYLLQKLMKKYKILPKNILGHSDIAPYRKIDPGKNFPWFILEERNLCFEIKNLKENKIMKCLIYKWYYKNKFVTKKKIILFMLNFIGYDVTLALKSEINYQKLISAYCYRFKYYKDNNYNKKNIFKVIQLHFFNIILTKLKK